MSSTAFAAVAARSCRLPRQLPARYRHVQSAERERRPLRPPSRPGGTSIICWKNNLPRPTGECMWPCFCSRFPPESWPGIGTGRDIPGHQHRLGPPRRRLRTPPSTLRCLRSRNHNLRRLRLPQQPSRNRRPRLQVVRSQYGQRPHSRQRLNQFPLRAGRHPLSSQLSHLRPARRRARDRKNRPRQPRRRSQMRRPARLRNHRPLNRRLPRFK